MPTQVDEEVCEIHFLESVPKDTCTICTKGITNKPSRNTSNGGVTVIIPADETPRQHSPFMWDPWSKNAREIPRDVDFVHITGVFTTRHIDELVDWLSELKVIEIVPSRQEFVTNNLDWFRFYHVGITVRCRYRQS